MKLDQLKHLLDILLAASASDGHTDTQESNFIRDYLDGIGIETDEDRVELESHQWNFELQSFDLEKSVAALGEVDADERVAILKVVESLTEADGVIDLREDDFLRNLAKSLGASEEELAGMLVDVIDDTPSPPPVPKS